MGITKGGVQKFAKKLLDKKLIYKTYLPDNKKDVIFCLTKEGNVAYKSHEIFEKKRFGKIYELMDSMEQSELNVLEQFLKELNKIVDADE